MAKDDQIEGETKKEPVQKRWISCDQSGKPTGGEVIGLEKPDDPSLVEVPLDFDPRRKKLNAGKTDMVIDSAAPEFPPDSPPELDYTPPKDKEK